MENIEDKVLNDFNDYLIMLSEMDKVGIRRKITLIEGYIHKIKNVINDQTNTEKRMIRLANDTTYFENNMDMDKFELISEYDDELFGNYNGGVVFIKKNV
jgi:hypothetical protein